jgi:hypothetical protein
MRESMPTIHSLNYAHSIGGTLAVCLEFLSGVLIEAKSREFWESGRPAAGLDRPSEHLLVMRVSGT